MNLTLGNWIGLICILLIAGGGAVGATIALSDGNKKAIIITAVISVLITLLIGVFMSWYNTNTASGIRNYKDYQSELSNGIEREITITAEDGRMIYYYKGKFDIETDHEDNYIKFEREDGMREIIYYGITDTVIITEVSE